MAEILTEPQLGEIRRWCELGYTSLSKCIWHACKICGLQRWVDFRKGRPGNKRCPQCMWYGRLGEKHPNWKRGKSKTVQGYIVSRLYPDDFFYPMANHQNYALEHRLLMARHLGRCLQSWEHVHHKNGVKDDNRIENLELTTNGAHLIAHNKGYKEGYQKGILDGHSKAIKDLQSRVTLLEAENELLRSQIEGGVLFHT